MEACEQDWETYNDHCYLWNTNTKNWTAAEDSCLQAGGHLASVPSDSTNDFIWEGMNRRGMNRLWLGGSDIEEEGVWKWTDCTPWEYTFWNPGEPNNNGDEACVLTYSNKMWNDFGCGGEKGFLCSKKICSGRIYQHFKK